MLSTPPPDLTGLSARNGGTFPIVAVLSQIDGYGRGHRPYEGVIMPEFGQLMTSEMTFVDTGDGVMTPTPVRLADLAAYIESLQAP